MAAAELLELSANQLRKIEQTLKRGPAALG